MNKEQVILLIQHSYLIAINDVENDCEQWCQEGSLERATEILEELKCDRHCGFNVFNMIKEED